MIKSGRISALLLVMLFSCFAGGLYALFELRFEKGDVFPAYSSLRGDPVGVKALYQALERIPGISSRRHYLDLSKLADPADTTLFYLGLRPDFLFITQKGFADKMESLVKAGTRLVLSFQSGQTKPAAGKAKQSGERGQRNQEEKQRNIDDKKENGAPDGNARRSIAETWEVIPAYAEVRKGEQQAGSRAVLVEPTDGLPPEISVHTGLYFRDPGQEWRILYSVGEQPVIMERFLGAGSIVLVADSYLFSNEAMRDERCPGVLAWLIGKNHKVAFDEYHLGVGESPGIMSMVRRYGLYEFLAALVLLAGLFVWRDAVPFASVRIERDEPQTDGAAGKDQLSGLVNLLRRNIETRDILEICIQEWEKTVRPNDRGDHDKALRIRDVMRSRAGKSFDSRDAVAAYRSIVRILSERTPK